MACGPRGWPQAAFWRLRVPSWPSGVTCVREWLRSPLCGSPLAGRGVLSACAVASADVADEVACSPSVCAHGVVSE